MAWYDRLLGVDQRIEEAKRQAFMGFVQEFQFQEADIEYPFEFGQPYSGRDKEKLGWAVPSSDYPTEMTYEERKALLLRAHQAWERNPLAKQGVGLIRRFVVGQGLSISYRNSQVRGIIENWRQQYRHLWRRWEKQLFDQLLIDGELFLRIFGNRLNGAEFSSVRVVPLKPWLVEAIETEPEDYTSVMAYHVYPQKGSGKPGDPLVTTGSSEEIAASEIIHAAINSLAYDMRGRSELGCILPWVRAYKEWLEGRARINRYKGLLYHHKLIGGTPSDMQTVRNRYKKPIEPGSILVTTDKEDIVELGGKVGADDVGEDGRAIKLMSIVGLGLPEYMLSDGQNSNLATTRSQQLPALRSFEDYQDIYIEQVWQPIYLAILKAALGEDATLPEEDEDGNETGEELLLEDTFSLQAPDIAEEDPKNLAEALQIAVMNGWVSNTTASIRLGFDYQKEQELIKREGMEAQAPSYGGPKEKEPEGEME